MADSAQTGKDITYTELVKRDISEPLGMNASSFLLMAFPEIATEAVRVDDFISRILPDVQIYLCIGLRFDRRVEFGWGTVFLRI